MITSRRRFLGGCSAAIAALAGSRLGYLGLAPAGTPSANGEVLVYIFLRGGMDGLSLVPPIAGDDRAHYEQARPRLSVPVTGTGAALRLNDQFGLHPSAAALLPLYQAGKLAIVQAVGSAGSRSHFDAMKYLELGTPGIKTTPQGWLTRHLETAPNLPDHIVIPALATGVTPPASLRGSSEMVNMVDANTFLLGQIGHWSWVSGDEWTTVRRLYQKGDSFIHTAGLQALNACGVIENYVRSNYVPANGAKYPDPVTLFGLHLKLIAQLIKLDVGLRVATVDLGGWDTHEYQGVRPGGTFSRLVTELSDTLAAFYTDLDDSSANAPTKRLTVIVQSEFGRRIRENANEGTDHGTGNPVLVLGGNVRGGLHGNWPGLHPDQRFDSADLAPTTDFRQVLSEVLIRRLGNPKLGEVFPKYSGYAPVDFVVGPDLAPDYSVPAPVTPADLLATRVGANTIRLTWGPASHASNFRIERRLDSNAPWVFLVILDVRTSRFDDTTVPDGANPGYRLQAFSSGGEGAFTSTAEAAGSRPIEQWRLRYFGTTVGTGPAADDVLTTEDGFPNFTKYALGLNPFVAATESTTGFNPGRPRLEVASGQVSLVYVRPTDRFDVRYRVLASRDLRTWTEVADVSDGTASGLERRRATLLTADPAAHFLKLTVEPA